MDLQGLSAEVSDFIKQNDLPTNLEDGLNWTWDIFRGLVVCFSILGLYDFLSARKRPTTRWFELHAVANMLVTVFATPALLQWISDPIRSVDPANFTQARCFALEELLSPTSQWPTLMINAIHWYHMVVFWNKLSSGDYFHHLVFVPAIGMWGGLGFRWGPVRNVLGWFICGLPGGIDYIMLVMMKNGVITFMTEKRWMSWINTWIRGPGLIVLSFTLYMAWRYGTLGIPPVVVIVIGILGLFNGIYYQEMAIGNYYKHSQLTGDTGAGC